MSILGSIVVSLEAQTAAFIQGMNAAAKTSRSVGREIENSFSDLGDVAEKALAPFGPLGEAIAATLSQVGSSAGSAIQAFGKMGGALGGITAIAGGAAAALSAVSLGALALAGSTAESIAKMGELSQSTGVSVGALSALAFAGKTVGLSLDQVSGGLEKMDKSVLKAATSPAGATSAFSRLHIALRDASGQIKPTEELFGELAARFSAMPDSLAKSGLAMQIFGRSGAEMLPLLNKGKAGIDDLIQTAAALGIVLDDQTVKASEQFKENLGTIEAAGQGLAIQLTKDLLPALQTVSSFLVSGLKDKNSSLSGLIDDVAWLTKAFLTLGDVVFAWFQTLESAVGNAEQTFIEFGTAAGKSLASAATLDWNGLVSAWKEGQLRLSAVSKQGANETTQIWANASKFIDGVWSPLAAATPTPRNGATPDTSAKADPAIEAIRARIAALQQEAAGWLLVSSAGTRAEQLIAEATKKGNDEFNKLKQEAARDKNDPAGALALVLQNEGIIKGAEAAEVFGAAIKSLNGDLDKQGDKFQEEGKAAAALAVAYRQGGSAIAAAAIGKQFASDAAQLDMLVQTQRLLAGTRTSGQILGPEAKDAAGYRQLSDAINVATKALQANKAAASASLSANLTAELAQEGSSFAALAPYAAAVSSAYSKGAAAVRAARIELELYKFVQDELSKGVIVTPVQLQQKKTDLTAQDQQSHQNAIQEEAAQYELNALYDKQIVTVLELKKAIQDNGQSTLLIDAKLFDSQNSLIHQWDEAALKVGTFGQRFQGVMNELVLQGKEAGEQIGKAFLTAIDGAETQLAKLLTGQKANFKQVAQGLGESLVKIGIQKSVGDIAGALGIKVGKPDGSESNPFHVVMKGGAGGVFGSSTAGGASGDDADGGSASGPGGILGSILKSFGVGGGGSRGGGSPKGRSGLIGPASGALDGALDKLTLGWYGKYMTSRAAAKTATDAGSGNAEALGGAVGGGIGAGEDAAADDFDFAGAGSGAGDFSSMFGGFMAAGGDVSPGKAYIVGEKRPEMFMPSVAGRISNSVPNLSGKPAKQINVTNHFNVPAPVDLFKKSNNQLNTEQARQLSVANSR